MNIRQQKYKQNRLAGMNQYNAAIAAGYSEKYAKQACRIEKLVKVSLADAFEQAGFTDKAIVAHALGGLTATKLKSCNIYLSKDTDGNYQLNENSNDFVEENDWNVRHKYFETILKLADKLKDQPLIDIDQSQHTKILVIENGKANEGLLQRLKDNSERVSE